MSAQRVTQAVDLRSREIRPTTVNFPGIYLYISLHGAVRFVCDFKPTWDLSGNGGIPLVDSSFIRSIFRIDTDISSGPSSVSGPFLTATGSGRSKFTPLLGRLLLPRKLFWIRNTSANC